MLIEDSRDHQASLDPRDSAATTRPHRLPSPVQRFTQLLSRFKRDSCLTITFIRARQGTKEGPGTRAGQGWRGARGPTTSPPPAAASPASRAARVDEAAQDLLVPVGWTGSRFLTVPWLPRGTSGSLAGERRAAGAERATGSTRSAGSARPRRPQWAHGGQRWGRPG